MIYLLDVNAVLALHYDQHVHFARVPYPWRRADCGRAGITVGHSGTIRALWERRLGDAAAPATPRRRGGTRSQHRRHS